MIWRNDLDALQFPAENGVSCFVHRRAFRAIIRKVPSPQDCLDFYERNNSAFEAAATVKLRSGAVADQQNFHLTSRQIRRSVAALGLIGSNLA